MAAPNESHWRIWAPVVALVVALIGFFGALFNGAFAPLAQQWLSSLEGGHSDTSKTAPQMRAVLAIDPALKDIAGKWHTRDTPCAWAFAINVHGQILEVRDYRGAVALQYPIRNTSGGSVSVLDGDHVAKFWVQRNHLYNSTGRTISEFERC